MADPTQKQRIAALKAQTYSPPPKAKPTAKVKSVRMALPLPSKKMAYTGFSTAPRPKPPKAGGNSGNIRKVK